MPQKPNHRSLTLCPFKRWVLWPTFLLTFLSVMTITTDAYCIEAAHNSEASAMPSTLIASFFANDFGVLAVLFGLSLSTLVIGLRMLLCPTAKQACFNGVDGGAH